ncbi:hypothetical protein FI667_g10001, partial [Globisporangium splendens]
METAMDEPPEDALASLDEFVEQLQACLLQWDPASDVRGARKQQFVEALTEIAALPLDSMSMEIRRLLVVHDRRQRAITSDQDDVAVAVADSGKNAVSDGKCENPALLHVLAALRCRDVLLKCKAANAVGSLCISRVAGQQLLDRHGDVLLSALMKMATCKNKWAQGDAFFVLGWIVVIAEDAMLAPIARLVPSVIRFLHRSVTDDENDNAMTTSPSSEDASNFRIYALVLLLNFMQRDSSAIAAEAQSLMQTLRAIVLKLNRQIIVADGNSMTATSLDPSEFVELLRLTVTFLSLVVDQIPAAAPLVLELTLLPALLKLSHVLQQVQSADLLGGDEQEAADLQTRMDAIIATVLASR